MKKGCRLIVPDGSLEKVVAQLLVDAGISISYPNGERSYRGVIGNQRLFPPPYDLAIKMRPWDSPWVVADRKAELAFTGEDLIFEVGCENEVVILDRYPLSRSGCGFTRLVLAVPTGSEIKSVTNLKSKDEVVTEYPNFCQRWLAKEGVYPKIRVGKGSIEAFVNIADAIFENIESGLSLQIGGWQIIEEVMKSQTCLITYSEALKDNNQKQIIEEFRLLLNSVISARSKRLVKCNVSPVCLAAVLAIMPSAGGPTVNKLAESAGFAVEAIVEAAKVESLIPRLKQAGATAIFETTISKFVL